MKTKQNDVMQWRYVGKDGMANDITIFGKVVRYGDVIDLAENKWPFVKDRYPFDTDPRFEAVK